MPKWWNWYTRTTQNRVAQVMRVRLSPWAQNRASSVNQEGSRPCTLVVHGDSRLGYIAKTLAGYFTTKEHAMEFVEENALYFLDGVSYAYKETEMAREIRAENSSARKQFLIECFEDVYGKPFPQSEPVIEENEFKPNVPVMLLNMGCCNHHGDHVVRVTKTKKTSGLKAGHAMPGSLMSSLETERGAAMTLPESLRDP